ncbi:hypothetical protein D3C81_1875570 [compost metagenome]
MPRCPVIRPCRGRLLPGDKTAEPLFNLKRKTAALVIMDNSKYACDSFLSLYWHIRNGCRAASAALFHRQLHPGANASKRCGKMFLPGRLRQGTGQWLRKLCLCFCFCSSSRFKSTVVLHIVPLPVEYNNQVGVMII